MPTLSSLHLQRTQTTSFSSSGSSSSTIRPSSTAISMGGVVGGESGTGAAGTSLRKRTPVLPFSSSFAPPTSSAPASPPAPGISTYSPSIVSLPATEGGSVFELDFSSFSTGGIRAINSSPVPSVAPSEGGSLFTVLKYTGGEEGAVEVNEGRARVKGPRAPDPPPESLDPPSALPRSISYRRPVLPPLTSHTRFSPSSHLPTQTPAPSIVPPLALATTLPLRVPVRAPPAAASTVSQNMEEGRAGEAGMRNEAALGVRALALAGEAARLVLEMERSLTDRSEATIRPTPVKLQRRTPSTSMNAAAEASKSTDSASHPHPSTTHSSLLPPARLPSLPSYAASPPPLPLAQSGRHTSVPSFPTYAPPSFSSVDDPSSSSTSRAVSLPLPARTTPAALPIPAHLRPGRVPVPSFSLAAQAAPFDTLRRPLVLSEHVYPGIGVEVAVKKGTRPPTASSVASSVALSRGSSFASSMSCALTEIEGERGGSEGEKTFVLTALGVGRAERRRMREERFAKAASQAKERGEEGEPWTRERKVLLVSVVSVFSYSLAGVVCSLSTYDNSWPGGGADVALLLDNGTFIWLLLASLLTLPVSLLGLSGVLLPSRRNLAIYTVLLWPSLLFLLLCGYQTYRHYSLNLPGKLDEAWSRLLSVEGRKTVQDALRCCGYNNAWHDATYDYGVGGECWPRTTLPGCKGPLERFEEEVLKRVWQSVFAVVGLQLVNITISLLCSNHVDRQFGKRLTPEAYRLTKNDVDPSLLFLPTLPTSLAPPGLTPPQRPSRHPSLRHLTLASHRLHRKPVPSPSSLAASSPSSVYSTRTDSTRGWKSVEEMPRTPGLSGLGVEVEWEESQGAERWEEEGEKGRSGDQQDEGGIRAVG